MKIEGDFIMTENLNIKEGLIVEGNIYGKNGLRYNINAGDINAGNINAGNINAKNITARDINYFAVCFAYKNINCKSIKGRRENCKHFVLDGEITIKKNIPEFIEKDGYKYKLVENEE